MTATVHAVAKLCGCAYAAAAAVEKRYCAAFLQVMFSVLGVGQEASPNGLRASDNMITINVFDEVVTPTAALKAMRAGARAGNGGGRA